MTKNKAQIIILCEDRQQEVFARHFLEKRGFSKIRPKVCPSGKQAAEQFVRKQYAQEVKTYRQKRNDLAIALVVLIDADKKTIHERLTQLDAALAEAGEDKRQPNEQIAVFVPKRNIETWIHHLQGENVNEDDKYRKLDQESECKPAVEKLVEQCQAGKLEPEPPPSLKQGCQEFQRIIQL